MAATVSNLGRGNYVLGGLGAVRGPSAADAMVENQQEARAAREAELLAQQRRQQMQLAQSEEARAQATFAQQQEAYRRQQAAAAEARNREAQRRALMAQYRAPGVGEAPVIFQPQAAPAAAPVVQPVNTTGYPVGVPVTRTGATRGRYRPDEGAGGDDVLGGGAGADTLARAPTRTFMTPESMAVRAGMAGTLAGYGVGVQPPAAQPAVGLDVTTADGIPLLPNGSPDYAALEQRLESAGGDALLLDQLLQPGLAERLVTPYTPTPLSMVSRDVIYTPGLPLDDGKVTEVDPTASAAMQDWQALSRRADIYNVATRIGNSVLAPTGRLADYILRTPEEGAQRAELEAERQRVRDWYASDEAQAIFQENPDLLQDAARDPLDFYAQRTAATERVPIEDVSLSFGTGEGGEVDEGPVLTFGGGLRTAESDSPIDFILGQPVGSGAVAPIPRELPRLNAAIQQGVTERQRLVDAYNAFYQAGFTEDANAYLTAIQNLDQTLIRLQGEQALNDLSIGYPERASMVLSHYLGADAQLVLNQESTYDLYVNGQPVENEDLLDMAPQDAADLVRRYYDSGYQESMQEIRNTYLTEKAKRQAEQDVKDEAALQALESAGFEVMGKETIEGLGDGWRSRDPRTGKEYFAYIVDIGEDGIPQTRVIEVPTGARIGG